MLNSTNFVWDIPGAKVGKTWKNRRDFRAPVPPDIGKATCKTAPGIHPCELAPKMWVKSTISSSRIKSHNSSSTTHSNIIKYWLVVKKTILKNDGVRQWEGWHPIYDMETNPRVWNHQPEYHHSRIETKQKDLQGPQGPRACWTETPWPPLYPGACGISCIWIFSAGRSCKASDRWQGGVRVCQPRKIIWVCLKIGYPRNKSDMFIPFFQDFPHQNCHFLHPISRQSHLQRAPHLSPWESGSGRPMT